jgi:predicted nucleic acid-binding protein
MKVLDTYALIEIFNGNEKYRHITQQEFEIPDLVMSEFWGVLLKKYSEAEANFCLERFRGNCKSCALDVLIDARRFKRENNKKNLSFVDCVGYIYAKTEGFTFVTGDDEFKVMDGVEFIK